MHLVGWRFPLAIAGFVGVIGAVCYPIAIAPMYRPETYSECLGVIQNH